MEGKDEEEKYEQRAGKQKASYLKHRYEAKDTQLRSKQNTGKIKKIKITDECHLLLKHDDLGLHIGVKYELLWHKLEAEEQKENEEEERDGRGGGKGRGGGTGRKGNVVNLS